MSHLTLDQLFSPHLAVLVVFLQGVKSHTVLGVDFPLLGSGLHYKAQGFSATVPRQLLTTHIHNKKPDN